jgi:translation initiation factor 2 subunit 1
MKKQGFPEVDELVVCKIVKIYPNSAFAQLVEYEKTGMIHVSEVASRWVRNIREFLKEGDYVVCKVVRIEGTNISLSVKRVHKEQSVSKLNEFKREKKADKMLELAAKSLKKSLDEAYKEVGFELQEQFGTMNKAFEIAAKNPALLAKKGIRKEWIEPLSEISKKSFSEKTFEIKAELELTCYSPDGVEIIKKVLAEAKKGKDVEIRYVSAPRYVLIGRGKNFKEIHAMIEQLADKIVKEINKHKGVCRFEMVEE